LERAHISAGIGVKLDGIAQHVPDVRVVIV